MSVALRTDLRQAETQQGTYTTVLHYVPELTLGYLTYLATEGKHLFKNW